MGTIVGPSGVGHAYARWRTATVRDPAVSGDGQSVEGGARATFGKGRASDTVIWMWQTNLTPTETGRPTEAEEQMQILPQAGAAA